MGTLHKSDDGAKLESFRTVDKLVKCKETGRFYRASYPNGWNHGDAVAAMFVGSGFYFREIVRVHRPWWEGGAVWQDTGRIWEPESGQFEIVKDVS